MKSIASSSHIPSPAPLAPTPFAQAANATAFSAPSTPVQSNITLDLGCSSRATEYTSQSMREQIRDLLRESFAAGERDKAAYDKINTKNLQFKSAELDAARREATAWAEKHPEEWERANIECAKLVQ